ncbi:hypothetical protein EV363DRAFT_1094268, partial [Boletus edulis]
IRNALQVLRGGRLSLLDCVLHILDSSKQDFAAYRRLFLANPSGKLIKMLDLLFETEQGRTHLLRWMEPHAVDLVSQKVSDEMDVVKKTLGGTVGTITPDSLRTWDINTFIGSLVDTKAPVTGHILRTAAETDRAKQKNKIKSCSTACNVIITQLAKERSQLTIYFAAPFTLFLWTNGASRQTIEALHKCGLCISFSSLTKLVNNLAAQVLDQAARFARGPHVMCYDNINISTSIFVEQR